MKIVVTGGCGFIGRALVKVILDNCSENDEIYIVDNCSRYGRGEEVENVLKDSRVSLLEGDLCDSEFVKSLPNKVDRLYHLAAIVGVGNVEQAPLSVLTKNTISSLNIFEWFQNNKTKNGRLLFSSTSEVYAGAELKGFAMPIPTPEDVSPVISDISNPRFSYAVSKVWAEAYLSYASLKHDLFSVIVRYHNVYGPNMGYQHVVPQIVERISKRQSPFKVIGSDQTRSFCWIEDAAQATYLSMESNNISSGDIVHIGNEQAEVSIKDLYDLIFDICDWKPEDIVYENAPAGSVPRRCPDTSFLYKTTGFRPQVSLSYGIEKTVEWYLKNTLSTVNNSSN